MDNSRQRLLEQFSSMAASGQLGDEIRASQAEYDSLQGIGVFLKIIYDCRQQSIEKSEFAEFREVFMQTLIATYRDAKRVDSEIAATFVNSFLEDYPGVPKSCLLNKWCSTSNACIASREVAKSNKKLLVWQQAIKQFQAYNEFLSGLLPYLMVLLRTTQNKTVNPSVFTVAYGNKVSQFKDISGGESGAFYLICKIAKPKLRNAIAHETIWLDSEELKVRYIDGKPPVEDEFPLTDFMALNSVASHLLQPYLAALSAIVVMENGTDQAKSLLPKDLVRLFNFVPSA